MEIEGSGASKELLCTRACELFGIKDFVIHIWDKGFEEWLDIEEDDIVEANSKVLITKTKVPAEELDTSMASSATSLSTDDECNSLTSVG